MEFDRPVDTQGDTRGRTTRRRALAGSALAAAALAVPWAARGSGHELRPWPQGQPTPALSLADRAGRIWTLNSLRGRLVVLNFWASWCAPCRLEMPTLERLQTQLGARGVTVLTVNYKEEAANIQRFLELRPLGLPILLDTDGETTAAWTPRVFPSTVLVDRAGVARTTVLGPLDWAGNEAQRLLRPLWTPAA